MAIEVILISGFFLAVQMLLLYMTRTAQIFVLTHAAFFVIFVPLLHLLQYLARENRPVYDFDIYLLSHILVLVYLVGFLLSAEVFRRFMSQDSIVIHSVLSVGDKTLTGILMAWLGSKTYLVIKYGPLALSGLKGEIEGAAEFRLEFYDVLLSTYVTYFAVGACVIFALKASISRAWPPVSHLSVFAIFLAIYLVLGEASIGARRFVLLMLLLAFLGASRAWIMKPKPLMITLSKMGLAGMLIAIMFSVYFQAVRFNLLQPEIAISLSSGNIGEMARGGSSALVPNADSDTEVEQPAMLRPGPFELIYDVLASESKTGATTRGHITTSSTQAMIPYIIAGTDKESVSVDKILVDELDIIPFDGFIDGVAIIDLPSSLLTIFIADYGLPGALLAPMIITAGLVLISLIAKFTQQSTLLTILAVSVLFQIIGNVEGDLLTVLTALRDFALSTLVITGAARTTKLIRQSLLPTILYARQRAWNAMRA